MTPPRALRLRLAVWEMTWVASSCLQRCSKQFEKCISFCCTAMIPRCIYQNYWYQYKISNIFRNKYKKWTAKMTQKWTEKLEKCYFFTYFSFANRAAGEAEITSLVHFNLSGQSQTTTGFFLVTLDVSGPPFHKVTTNACNPQRPLCHCSWRRSTAVLTGVLMSTELFNVQKYLYLLTIWI